MSFSRRDTSYLRSAQVPVWDGVDEAKNPGAGSGQVSVAGKRSLSVTLGVEVTS